MNKYNYNLDVAKVYLKNMYVIDTNKDYKSSKLNLLKELKIDLISNNLLKFNNIIIYSNLINEIYRSSFKIFWFVL